MPTTIEALIVLVLAVAPGLLFELGIERGVAYWRTTPTERVLRFFAWSFVFHAVALPVSVWTWEHSLRDANWKTGDVGVWPLYGVALGYTLVPVALGFIAGGHNRAGAWMRARLFGRNLPPRAWDHLFGSETPEGFVRARLKASGTWVAGTWGYASSHPAAEDVLLDRRVACDPETGELQLDTDGYPREMGWSILLCRDDLDRLEFQPFRLTSEENTDD